MAVATFQSTENLLPLALSMDKANVNYEKITFSSDREAGKDTKAKFQSMLEALFPGKVIEISYQGNHVKKCDLLFVAGKADEFTQNFLGEKSTLFVSTKEGFLKQSSETIDKNPKAELFSKCLNTHGEEQFQAVQLFARDNALAAAKYFKNFGIKDPEMRFVVAMLCSQNIKTLEHFANFELEDSDARFVIAKLYANTDVNETLRNLGKFKLNSSQTFEILKICALKDGKTVIEQIETFKLDKKKAVEIFTLCAKQNPGSAFQRIHILSDSPPELFKWAKFCLNQEDGVEAVAKNYNDFSRKIGDILVNLMDRNLFLEAQQQSFEIAKLCAEKDPKITLKYLDNFSLKDSEKFEILKICASSNKEVTAKYLANFKLDPNQKLKIEKLLKG